MSLEHAGHLNDLSVELRNKLTEKVLGFGKRVRYKFDIAKHNPDPQKFNGNTIYPNMYTLDPAKFTIMDNYEKREGKSKVKQIALVLDVDDKGVPNKFKKVKVSGSEKGVLTLEVADKPEDMYTAMYLELHPKLKGGEFADKNTFQVISRIDEKAHADTERKERSAKLQALQAAQKMSDSEVVDFADALMWNSTDEVEILRNQIEELAEREPIYFNDIVSSNKIAFQSSIKKAMDRGIISFDPGEYKFFYTGNNQPIAVLSPSGDKSEVEKLAEWFMAGGEAPDKAFKKIKSLLKTEKEVA